MRTKNAPHRDPLDTVDGERLVQAFLLAKTPETMRLFLKEVLTEKQIDQCSKKLWAAEMMFAGAPYEAIENTTRLSSKTVARIAKGSIYGKGYQVIMDKLHPKGFRYEE